MSLFFKLKSSLSVELSQITKPMFTQIVFGVIDCVVALMVIFMWLIVAAIVGIAGIAWIYHT
jgi:hypothetical protein